MTSYFYIYCQLILYCFRSYISLDKNKVRAFQKFVKTTVFKGFYEYFEKILGKNTKIYKITCKVMLGQMEFY